MTDSLYLFGDLDDEKKAAVLHSYEMAGKGIEIMQMMHGVMTTGMERPIEERAESFSDKVPETLDDWAEPLDCLTEFMSMVVMLASLVSIKRRTEAMTRVADAAFEIPESGDTSLN